MSNKVEAWVWAHSTAEGYDRFVHVAMGDEARDDGYLSGKHYGSVAHLANDKTKLDRKTVIGAIKKLEATGELLVWRPADRGSGRHNEYVVLMGRDPVAVGKEFGWSRVDPGAKRSPGGTNLSAEAPDAAQPAADTDPAMDGPSDSPEGHRDVQAAPPATVHSQPTEAVDGDAPSSPYRSLRGTNATARNGPGPVQDRSVLHGPFPSTQVPEVPARSAREARAGDDELVRLGRQLSAEGLSVRWDLAAAQRDALLEHLAEWPPDAGVAAFAAAAKAAVREYGLPRSVRAWVPAWLELLPPAVHVASGGPCPAHPGAAHTPTGECGACRADQLAATP